MRFEGFEGEWETTTLTEISQINPKSGKLEDSFIYIDLESVEKGILKKRQEINLSEAPSRAQRVINTGDILFQCVRPYQKNNYIHKALSDNCKQWVASTGYAQIRTNENPNYIYHLLNTDSFNRKVIVRCTGSSYPAINSEDLSKIRFSYTPNQKEQLKISRLLDLLDERIDTQNKIIDKLESLIKGLAKANISHSAANTRIADCLDCHSSALQESQVSESGLYPVYSATGISGYIETSDVTGESILIIKDGSSVGSVKFADGEYSYIGTLNRLTAKDGYCLKFLYFVLQGFNFEPYKTGMAIPHIYFKDYGKARIYCPTIEKQLFIANNLSNIESKKDIEKQMLLNLQLQKSYLLSQIFI